MLRLKDRQKFIPNGFQFYLPEVKWQAPRMVSFDRIVNELLRITNANRALALKNQWPTDRKSIEDWVDTYNAALCLKMGWDEYVTTDGGTSVPKTSAPHQLQTLQSLRSAAARAKALVRGAKSLLEWDESGEPAVPSELSTHRAIICSMCPQNKPGDFSQWFTIPAAELIKRRIEALHQRKLSTPRDEYLNLCAACACPLKLKVHIPIEWITKRLTPEQISGLKHGKDCWILNEMELKGK